jgi:hypothetical protein
MKNNPIVSGTSVIADNTGSSINSIVEEDEAAMVLLQPFSTLDEPIRETILRDVRAVLDKLRVVVLPLDTSALKKRFGRFYSNISEEEDEEELSSTEQIILYKLRDWDLWGPLLVCLALSILLSMKANNNPKEASAVFATVFVMVWLGAAIVTINAKLLGGVISFFQCVCVLGYCIFPMVVASLLITIFRIFLGNIPLLNLVWVVLAFLWCTRASTIFIGQFIQRSRRELAVFPVFFFYSFLGWMVLEL